MHPSHARRSRIRRVGVIHDQGQAFRARRDTAPGQRRRNIISSQVQSLGILSLCAKALELMIIAIFLSDQ